MSFLVILPIDFSGQCGILVLSRGTQKEVNQMEKRYEITYEMEPGRTSTMKTTNKSNARLIEYIFGYKVLEVKEIIINNK